MFRRGHSRPRSRASTESRLALKTHGCRADAIGVDGAQVAQLRDALRGTLWWSRAQAVGSVVRRTATPGGLLLVGTPDAEPWHLTAHLADEAHWSGQPQLQPTLVRWAPPANARPHLAVTFDRLEQVRRGETLLVVSPDVATPAALLERVDSARRLGATVVAIDGGDPELEDVAHERLIVAPGGLCLPEGIPNNLGLDGMELAQHLVSSASGQAQGPTRRREGLLARLSR